MLKTAKEAPCANRTEASLNHILPAQTGSLLCEAEIEARRSGTEDLRASLPWAFSP